MGWPQITVIALMAAAIAMRVTVAMLVQGGTLEPKAGRRSAYYWGMVISEVIRHSVLAWILGAGGFWS